jgi:NTE family protein
MLLKSIREKQIDGFLFRIGTSARQFKAISGKLPGLTDEQCAFCLNYPTDLLRIELSKFDLLADHGSEVAQLTLFQFAGGRFTPRTNDDALVPWRK